MKKKYVVSLLSGCVILAALCGCKDQEKKSVETTVDQVATVESTATAEESESTVESEETMESETEETIESLESVSNESEFASGTVSECIHLEESDPFYGFINGNVGAKQEDYELYASEMYYDEEDPLSYFAYETVDVDNDGEKEFHLQNGYGGILIDWNGKDYQVLASGEGTAYQLYSIEYENATWIMNCDVSHGGRKFYFLRKYHGRDIEEEISLSAEYWECEYESDKTVFMYNEDVITREEFEEIVASFQYN